VALILVWSADAGVTPGLSFHFLGATVLTLMFGWRLALLGLSAVLFALTLNGDGGWSAFGLNGLMLAALPVAVSQLVYQQVDQRLPKHFFIYIFICAFLGAAAAMAATALASVVVLILSGVYSLERLSYEYLPFFPLIVFPEALLNGMIMTLLVALRPQWVCTFDDRRYLDNK
jgi:uncharacterized membrane protein